MTFSPTAFRLLRRMFVSLATIVFAWRLALPFQAQAAENPQPGRETYLKYCATCHGMDPRGGNAKTLFDDVWQYGSGRDKIAANIRQGLVPVGMPAYGQVLSEAQIGELTDFILAMRGKSLAAAAPAPPTSDDLRTLDYMVKVEHWIGKDAGLEIPWAIDFLDARTALVTERPGRLRLVQNGKLLAQPVANTPRVLHQGQGGLLDVAVDPQYAKNGWIYLGYSHALGEGRTAPAMTRIVRGKILDNAWTGEQLLFEAKPETYLTTRIHFGTRIVFDREGSLYFSIGERGRQEMAQDVTRPNGKIHRIQPDGAIPRDNPFAGQAGAVPSIFSFGHRNPQGLAFHPETGELWLVEHGPLGGDEVNISRKGKNYGWPLITYGLNYNGTIITEERQREGLEQPVYYWRPSIAVSGLDFYRGELFPHWKNHLLAASLKAEELRLLDVKENRVLHDEVIVKGLGRIREAVSGPDGAIYVVLNEPDEILRLTPAGRTKY